MIKSQFKKYLINFLMNLNIKQKALNIQVNLNKKQKKCLSNALKHLIKQQVIVIETEKMLSSGIHLLEKSNNLAIQDPIVWMHYQWLCTLFIIVNHFKMQFLSFIFLL